MNLFVLLSTRSHRLKFQRNLQNATTATKILTNNRQSGILPLTKEALNHLKFKHAEAKVSSAEVLLDDVTRELNPIKFDAMNE